ncbi:MAG: deoxyribose-phosphate aldolase [Elusimicrobia bacterium]|nr:deoxyribose-phosphate aldolase [Elusimicrobiota bacterium]
MIHPIARLIDHTLLRPTATFSEIEKVCDEAKQFSFAAVCVAPAYVSLAAKVLRGSPVKVCTTIGFPLGTETTGTKVWESRDAIANGAEELDMVLNLGFLKSGDDARVLQDIRSVREAAEGKILKVILETALLDREEKVRACRIAQSAGADFVKTSTGFSKSGATLEDVRLMRETVGPRMGVKAAGGIQSLSAAEEFVQAGATRIGSSASVAIVTGTAIIEEESKTWEK